MSGKTFSNLLSYYIACLEQEDRMSVTFNVSSEGTAFLSTLFQKELLFHTNNNQVMVTSSEDATKFFQTSLLQQQDKTLYYGYPIVIGPEGTMSPLFYTEIQHEQQGDMIRMTALSHQPQLNRHILSQNNFSLEEIKNIQQEIEGEIFLKTLDSICTMLHLDGTECSSNLDQNPFKRTITQKLLNKAIIYFGEHANFTHNLIMELTQLKKKPLDDLASTALILLLTGEYTSITEFKHQIPLLEIYPLNPAQEQAVQQSLQSSCTVITGPPGTGKSQVVLNIIANAVLQNKTILFASRNNKAVDVVIEKLHTILPYHFLVRMGHQVHRRNAKSALEDLIKKNIQMQSKDDKTIHDLQSMKSKIVYVNDQLRILSSLNQSLDEAQNILDTISNQSPDDIAAHNNHQCLDGIDFYQLQCEYEKFFKKPSILHSIYPERYTKKQDLCFRKYYSVLPSSLKLYVQQAMSTKNTSPKTVLDWILSWKKEQLTRDEIKKIKQKLLANPSYIELKKRQMILQKEYIEISRNVFIQSWVEKLATATEEDKQNIVRYFSVSEHLESGKEDKTMIRQLHTQRLRILQKILKFLPIWVVTNLSAKQSFPLKNNLFDILIIDEASQCDIISALPLFYRAKQVVIIGDPFQLKHISLLSETQDLSLATTHRLPQEYFRDLSYSKHSLYDMTQKIVQKHEEEPLLLNEHYRCHPDIALFSNEYYYRRKLTIATDETRLLHHPLLHGRILWCPVKGKTVHAKSPYNEEEAERVVEELLRLLELISSTHASIGVVTLFRAQAEIITEKLKKFQDLFEADITIGTAHRFQGDEKDVIIFSPGVSEGVKPGTLQWIQATNQLVNVAVTRARSLFLIIGDQDVCKQTTGPLRNLLEYVELRSNTPEIMTSPLKQKLYEELKKQEIPVIPNYWINENTPMLIDFALFVNGKRYAILLSDSLIDNKKDLLKKDGWRMRRFTTQDLQNDLAMVIEEITRLC
jgi:hypothetical protein